jgi:hypothetical protein
MTKFTSADLSEAVTDLSLIEFFPSSPNQHAAVGLLLARICPHREALSWLVRTYTDHIGRWHGPMELRAVLCTRYRPADGIEAWSQLPGFRASDAEQRHLDQHAALKAGSAGELPEGPRLVVRQLAAGRAL